MKKLIFSSLLIASLMVSFVYAEEIGPGAGIKDNSDAATSRIYGYGDIITGINGNAINEANAYEKAPTYTEYNILNPIDNSTIDMGPTSGYYDGQYSQHSINDGGPGTGVETNVYGKPVVYGGGPGMDISVNQNVSNGPTTVYQNITPDDYYKLYNMTPGQFASSFVGSDATDKTN